MIRIYSGLTLDVATALKILPGAHVSPPIRRGDLLDAVDDCVHIAVIIDGKFHQDLAVTPDEVMDALRCGLKVYGASSMGALRASELHTFGMIGHGLIFNHIIATENFRDDYVAQVFSETDGNITILSHNYMDFYMNLHELELQKRITVREKTTLLRQYSDIFYADRSWAALRAALCKGRRPDPRLLKLGEEACLRMGSQKRRDAVGVLRRVGTDLKHVQKLNERFSR